MQAAENAASYVHRLAQAAISEMRALIFELRPESLAQDGLVAALERQVASLRARHALPVDATFGPEPALALDKKEALYRIAQESLHNATRHARAHALRLRVQQTDGHVVLEVADDGVGFDPSASYPGHLGLVSMRERAAAVGGTLTIHSAPGAGTRITADLPL
jgi:signal transduction histidine kinase